MDLESTSMRNKIADQYPGFLPDRIESFRNSRGCRIMTFWYPTSSAKPKGKVIMIHGISGHFHAQFSHFPGGTYANSWVEAVNKAGFHVRGVDLQSHGLSGDYQGLRCHCHSFDDFVKDALRLIHEEAKLDDLPIFLLGCSMGGAVSILAANEASDLLSGLILMAPMTSVEKIKAIPMNRILFPLLKCFARWLPWLPAGSKSENPVKEIHEEFMNDPYTYKGLLRVSMAAACIGVCETIQPLMTCPVLMMHSTDDPMTDPEGSETFFKALNSKMKTIFWINGMTHGLTKEEGCEVLAKKACEWLTSSSSSSSSGGLGNGNGKAITLNIP